MRYWGMLLIGVAAVAGLAAPAHAARRKPSRPPVADAVVPQHREAETIVAPAGMVQLPAAADKAPILVERYAAPRPAYYTLAKPLGSVIVQKVLIGRAGRASDGQSWWRIGMSVRNLTNSWQTPRITMVFFRGNEVLGTLPMYDGGFPLAPGHTGWQSILVPMPRGVAPDGFGIIPGE